MATSRYADLDGALTFIQQHLHEPLPLSRLASYVAYSPYHFTRIFKERTGLSPLYYVSALRLQKAKDLLLRTDLSVREVGLEIGQQSLGTFTTRFTERVGITPSAFRNSALHADHNLRSLQKLTDWRQAHPPYCEDAIIEGTVQADLPFSGVVLIGLFAKPIPEGLPVRGTLVSALGPFRITDVKPGTYYLMSTSVSWGMQALDFLLPQNTLRARAEEPIVVEPGGSVPHQQIVLRPPRLDDPPILISIPLLMNIFLSRVRQNRNL